jgi:hypothetical protein
MKMKEALLEKQKASERDHDLLTAQPSSPPTDIKTEIDGFRQAAIEDQHENFAGTMLRYVRGKWIYKGGHGKEEIPLGTRLVLLTSEVRRGWTKWIKGKPVAHALVRICEGLKPPRREELGDTNEAAWPVGLSGTREDPWQFTYYLPFVADDGNLYTFSTATYGGRKEAASLCGRYAGDAPKHPGAVPIVQLGTDSYENKTYGSTVATPRLDIVGWTDRPAVMLSEPKSEPEPEPEPGLDDEIPL